MSDLENQKPDNKNKNKNSNKPKWYPNPPDNSNPDAGTLRDQWRYAIRQYSKWYSHAWGTAILAGISFFALGWIIKGQNPLPYFQSINNNNNNNNNVDDDDDVDEQQQH